MIGFYFRWLAEVKRLGPPNDIKLRYRGLLFSWHGLAEVKRLEPLNEIKLRYRRIIVSYGMG
jgi:hypothetical protein